MTVEIKLTPTKVEQLREIQKHNRAVFEEERPLEDIARELLYDAIGIEYNRYREAYYEEIESEEEDYPTDEEIAEIMSELYKDEQ